MDIYSIVFSFTPINGLSNDSKQISEDLHLSETHPKHELYSRDNMKLIKEMNFESASQIELNEAVFLRSKSFIIEKPSISF